MKTNKAEYLELILFVTLFAQLFCGITLFLWAFEHRIDAVVRVTLIAELPLIMVSFLIFTSSRLLIRTEIEKEKEQQETRLQLERSYQLIQSLEAQRHDFRNHLQVIRTLAGMGKMEAIEEYVQECGANLDNMASMARVGDVVLQALLLTFQSKAKEFEINFEVDCQADLTSLNCSPVKLSRIFSNLLQNAAEAVALQKESPTISLALWQDENSFRFVFWNNGPPIPPEDLHHIFTPGFSSKLGEHRGYGLHIVKTLVEELGGEVTVNSNEADGTEFTVTIPAGRPKPRFP